jgi:hypothetical protein
MNFTINRARIDRACCNFMPTVDKFQSNHANGYDQYVGQEPVCPTVRRADKFNAKRFVALAGPELAPGPASHAIGYSSVESKRVNSDLQLQLVESIIIKRLYGRHGLHFDKHVLKHLKHPHQVTNSSSLRMCSPVPQSGTIP